MHQPAPFLQPPVPVQVQAQAAPVQQIELLQEIMLQQQVLRQQQEALQANAPPIPVPDAPDVVVEADPPALNALQAWQLNWQQNQQQQLRHLQPFLADPAIAVARPVRPPATLPPPPATLPPPPGAIRA